MTLSNIIGICRSCDKERYLYDVQAMDASLFCQICIQKFGWKELRHVADAALRIRETPKKQAECMRCQSPLMVDALGKVKSLFCAACDEKYKERFGKKVRFF